MTLGELVKAVMLKATGKVASLATTDKKYQAIVELANLYQRAWQNEPGVNWKSLKSTATIGTVSSASSYKIKDDIDKISSDSGDYVKIEKDGRVYKYRTVAPGHNSTDIGQYCEQRGRQLIFSKVFSEVDPEFNGIITAPVYLNVGTLKNERDVVQVDQPDWLVYMIAAIRVEDSITKRFKQPLLINEANQCMQKMKDNNAAGQEKRKTLQILYSRMGF